MEDLSFIIFILFRSSCKTVSKFFYQVFEITLIYIEYFIMPANIIGICNAKFVSSGLSFVMVPTTVHPIIPSP